MAQITSDGTVSWIGGMDTSRHPMDITQIQYAKSVNTIIKKSSGGIGVRPAFHHCRLRFDSKQSKEIYEKGFFQGEGHFESGGRTYLIAVYSGYVFKFTKQGSRRYYVENVNSNDRNSTSYTNAWVTKIPNGCIVNNGYNYPLYVTENNQRRTNPEKGEIGIGRMGIYVQNRLFYVDQSGRQILASDFLQPIKFTLEDTNIFGFSCPDEDEQITAIGKQKSILNNAEGGNLVWSSTKDIYSADVRGSRSDWSNLGTRVGKVTETIPGFSAASSYSFESFNTNIYFRSKQFGIVDIKQSEYQFVNLDTVSEQSIEASYFLDNDTDWMLHRCYTKACDSRLFTTVGAERTQEGHIFWNGILSFSPAAIYANQGTIPRRFESVFTGVRPWGLTVIDSPLYKDEMFIHSHDTDGVNRMYVMDEDTNYDIDSNGNIREIEGFIETRAYSHESPFLLKNIEKRFYGLRSIDRSIDIKIYSRPDGAGQWVEMWQTKHLVCRTEDKDKRFLPHKPQTRPFISVSEEKFSDCHSGKKVFSIQYRIEFKGPINLSFFATSANLQPHERVTYQDESDCITLIYNFLPDYNYSISYKP